MADSEEISSKPPKDTELLRLLRSDMARVCDLTGKRTHVGNTVSHANNKSKRKFYPNLQKKRFFVPEENAWITLRVAASTMRTINKNGIDAVLKKAAQQGYISY